MLSRVKTAKYGNLISASSVIAAIVITLIKFEIYDKWLLYVLMFIGALIGIIIAYRIKMIKMPQLIASLNGIGGFSSLIVGVFALYEIGIDNTYFSKAAGSLAVVIGTITFIGSLIAFLRLGGYVNQKPTKVKLYKLIVPVVIITLIGLVIASYFISIIWLIVLLLIPISGLFAVIFTISIGGADMPITISLLNSFSGLAVAISGLAISDLLLVSYGGIVGASGLILTNIMCHAMNKRLIDIILGRTTTDDFVRDVEVKVSNDSASKENPVDILMRSKDIIIVPGYGMAISQAQSLVKNLANYIKSNGGRVRFAIHPIAGRMPGHMNVLLAEVDVDYDDLYDIDQINNDFKMCDLVIVIGANDVINPAAKTNEGTPIYGMPILNVYESRQVFVFNYDLKPGYSGVNNSLYEREEGIYFFLGDAKEKLTEFISKLI